MAMAIHAAKILSETITKHWKTDAMNRGALETEYHQLWHRQFANRLSTGCTIQRLFGSTLASNIGVTLANIQPIALRIVGLTHGRVF